ncbi:MAG: hypothetical protein JWO68_3429 [Actinomycetia bacterium]|nr:hypothetical protein [Actinomycetes bacterium]
MNAPLLSTLLTAALGDGEEALGQLTGAEPSDRRDRFLTLLAIYDLHTAPVPQLGDAVRFQNHPTVAHLKHRLEAAWLAELEQVSVLAADTVPALRAYAAKDRVPEVYRWLADGATWEQLVEFLALEGGPDAGFDDLVAACQFGLSGRPKLELATNYWDEMGNGSLDGVHTILHDNLVAAIDMPHIDRREQPVPALERTAFGGLLATNRWLQPEMVGALGLIELQAGPRCRTVLQAFDRLGAPDAAYPFYAVHAEVDPMHGRTWLENAIVPLLEEHPAWGPRIVRGASWRSAINATFFEQAWTQVLDAPVQVAVG